MMRDSNYLYTARTVFMYNACNNVFDWIRLRNIFINCLVKDNSQSVDIFTYLIFIISYQREFKL